MHLNLCAYVVLFPLRGRPLLGRASRYFSGMFSLWLMGLHVCVCVYAGEPAWVEKFLRDLTTSSENICGNLLAWGAAWQIWCGPLVWMV